MKTIKLKKNSEAEELVNQGVEEEVLFVRDGHAVALLMPFDDDDLEWYVRERDPAFIKSIAKARQQVAERKTISMKDLKREFGIK